MRKKFFFLLVFGPFSLNVAFADLNDGLAAHYKFEGNSLDSTGTYNGVETGGVNHIDGTERGKVVDLSFGYVQAAATGVIVDDSTSFSVSLWAKPDGVGQAAMISQRAGSSNDWRTQFGIWRATNNEPYFRVYGIDSAGNYTNQTARPAVQMTDNSRWYHIVGIYDGSNVSIYIDGELADSKPYSDRVRTVPGSYSLVGFNPTNQYWDGKLDDVRIYNRALVPDEVRQLYKGVSLNTAVFDNFDNLENWIIRDTESETGGPNANYWEEKLVKQRKGRVTLVAKVRNGKRRAAQISHVDRTMFSKIGTYAARVRFPKAQRAKLDAHSAVHAFFTFDSKYGFQPEFDSPEDDCVHLEQDFEVFNRGTALSHLAWENVYYNDFFPALTNTTHTVGANVGASERDCVDGISATYNTHVPFNGKEYYTLVIHSELLFETPDTYGISSTYSIVWDGGASVSELVTTSTVHRKDPIMGAFQTPVFNIWWQDPDKLRCGLNDGCSLKTDPLQPGLETEAKVQRIYDKLNKSSAESKMTIDWFVHVPGRSVEAQKVHAFGQNCERFGVCNSDDLN